MNLKPTFVAVAAALLGACAATPGPPPPELQQARDAVNQAAADPAVLVSASVELKRATEALNRANALHNDGSPRADVASAAYVAEQQARTAMLLANAKQSEDAMKSAQAERERARADAKEAEARRALANAAAAHQHVQAAHEQLASAERRAADAQQEAALLLQRLTELQAKETERGLLVTLGDVLFEFDRAEVRPTGRDALRRLADFLQRYPDRQLLIEGHTDSVGSDEYNLTLSLRRAQAVAAELIALGVSPLRIKAIGYGEDFPIVANSTDTNRALNRRVEVYISQAGQTVRPRPG
jgi:outer membrane protein OmpA-like peptidoglycan-associated protein